MKENRSETVMMETQCPFCGKVFDYPMCTEIIIPGDSKLKKKVLNKTLFVPKCPHCNEEFKLKPKCMYRNETKREWFVVTDSKDGELENVMKGGDLKFNDVRAEENIVDFMKGLYTRRVVYDVDAFREKILLSEYNFDDRIIELMKFSLSGLIEKDSHTHVYRIFLEESSGNDMVFTAILGSHAPFEYATIKSDLSTYNQYRTKYLKKLGNPNEDEYITTDQEWAAKTGLLKDEDAGFVVPMQG